VNLVVVVMMMVKMVAAGVPPTQAEQTGTGVAPEAMAQAPPPQRQSIRHQPQVQAGCSATPP
jgi:hypothetical protein